MSALQHFGLGTCGCKECDYYRKHPQLRPRELGGLSSAPLASKTQVIVFKDGSHRILTNGGAWELQNDPDWLVTVELPAPETTAPRTLSATERLHNLCDALSEQADESPFTREEWERIDAQTVAVQNAARALLDKMETVRSLPYHAPAWEKEANALRALVGRVKPLPVKSGAEHGS